MYIDGIVHHTFVQAVAGNDFTFTTREVGSISLSREISRIVFTTQTYIELFEGNVFRNLCQQAHSLCIMHTDVFQTGILTFGQEDTRSRTLIVTHSHLCSRNQSGILPMRRAESTLIQLFRIIGRTPEVTGLVHHMAGFSIECNTGLRIVFPSFAITFKMGIFTNSSLGPRFDEINHTIITIFHNLNLSNMRFCKVNTEILQHGIFRTDKRNGKHAAIEIEIGTATIQSQILPVFQCQAHRFRVRLVVVGNVVFLLESTVGMKIITTFFKNQGYILAFVLLLDKSQRLLHLGRKILLSIRLNAIIAHVYSLFLRTSAHQHDEQT